MKFFTLALTVLFFSSALSAQVFYSNNIFNIYFPTEPTEKSETVKTESYKIKLHSLTSSNEEGRVYSINFYEYPENTRNLSSTRVAKSILQSFSEQKKIESEDGIEAFSHKRNEGMELNGLSEAEDKYYNVRVLLFRGYLIQLTIISKKTAPHKKVVKNFYKGFSLINVEDN